FLSSTFPRLFFSSFTHYHALIVPRGMGDGRATDRDSRRCLAAQGGIRSPGLRVGSVVAPAEVIAKLARTLLCPLQIVLALFSAATGPTPLPVPPALPAPLQWLYALPPAVHYVAGTADVLAALGVLLPGLTPIQTRLTPLAASRLAVVMV